MGKYLTSVVRGKGGRPAGFMEGQEGVSNRTVLPSLLFSSIVAICDLFQSRDIVASHIVYWQKYENENSESAFLWACPNPACVRFRSCFLRNHSTLAIQCSVMGEISGAYKYARNGHYLLHLLLPWRFHASTAPGARAGLAHAMSQQAKSGTSGAEAGTTIFTMRACRYGSGDAIDWRLGIQRKKNMPQWWKMCGLLQPCLKIRWRDCRRGWGGSTKYIITPNPSLLHPWLSTPAHSLLALHLAISTIHLRITLPVDMKYARNLL